MIERLSPSERSAAVRTMFGDIAPRYDRANSVLSGGMHHRWRRTAVERLALQSGDRVLDVCCGTGDLALCVGASLGADGEVVGTDFSPEMVEEARAKAASQRLEAPIRFEVADATDLPFEAGRFDAATVGFGIRNVVDPVRGLAELARVVRPGGRVLVLEFGQPSGLFGAHFRAYSRWIMPFVGGLLTGRRAAYEYLPRTSAAFPAGDDFVSAILEPAGLVLRTKVRLTLGIAWIYVAEVPS